MIRKTLVTFSFLILCAAGAVFALERTVEEDRDKDGRKETRILYRDGQIVKVFVDHNGDQKADEVISFQNGVIDHGEKDEDFDGATDLWTKFAADGTPVILGRDRHKDGKPDYWIHLQNGKVVQRDWDRNFDGKPDLRTFETNHELTAKQYDDNFDGVFEKTVKAPRKGDSGRVNPNA